MSRSVDAVTDWLLSGLGKQAYVLTSRARVPAPIAVSEEAAAVYRTMVRAYVEWAEAHGVSVEDHPQEAVNGFLEHRCAGPAPWSEGTYRRYARLLTRLHWAVQGGALIVVKGWDETRSGKSPQHSGRGTASGSDGDIQDALSLGTDAWITRAEIDRLTAPLFEMADAEPSLPWKTARNLVILSFGLDLGLRFQEIRRLRQGSFNTEPDETRVKVHRDETARTARHRTVTIGDELDPAESTGMARAHRLLRGWLHTMPPALRGADRPILPSTAKGGLLTPSTVFRILQGLGAHSPEPQHWLFQGGVQALRRAHIHLALAEGVPAAELQARLGIHHLASIERYLDVYGGNHPA